MAAKKRTKIPNKTEGLLIYKSDFKCCICPKKGDHIHHLDGNPNNNHIDNLALLCFDHHNLATIKNSLSKTLKKEAIINYREHHYRVIKNNRKKALGELDSPITKLTEEKLLTATKTAQIILELENIKEQYFSAEWDRRSEIIEQLSKYVNHTNVRLAYDLFDFLSLVATQTRGGMTENVASSILGLIINFCPSLHEKKAKKQSVQLAKLCIHIGNNIVYDACIHLRKLNIATYGLAIIKFIYREAKRNSIQELQEEVSRTYNELESTLHRPERTDLAYAQELLKIYRNDLDEWDLSLPFLPKHLMSQLEIDKKG